MDAATTPRPDVVFVGLGAMGLPMARRLVRAGFALVGVEPGAPARERARAEGLHVVPEISAAPAAAVVVVMVADGAQLAAVVDAGLAGTVGQATWILMSTVGPEAAREQGRRLRDGGARVVDAPVTGGVAGAVSGQLTLFCAGAQDHVDDVRPVLTELGRPVVVGPEVGGGQAVKVVNQLLCSVHLVAAAEALALAERLGLDPEAVRSAVRTGAAGSWMLDDRGPRMLADADEEVRSAVDIFVKDSGLVRAAAEGAGADVPLLLAARERFLAARERGLGRADDSRVIDVYRRG